MDQFQRAASGAQRILMEDSLKHLFECEEAGRGLELGGLAAALGGAAPHAAEALAQLHKHGWIDAENQLTAEGRRYALQIVRYHRLYETWLARETGTPPADWHRHAHKAEHEMEASRADAMANALNNPRFDPHGDPIPTRDGRLPKRALVALSDWASDATARIEHIEDEPADLFRAAEAMGLSPGSRLDGITHLADGSVDALVEGCKIRLPAAVVPLVQVSAPAVDELVPADLGRLADLSVGGSAVVFGLAPSCMGAERRRLLDLGVVPGTVISCEFTSMFGSPRSYRIRGALIALRAHQAQRILVHPPVLTDSNS